MTELQPGERVRYNHTLTPLPIEGVVIGIDKVSYSQAYYMVGRDVDGVLIHIPPRCLDEGTLVSLGMCTDEEIVTHSSLHVRNLITGPHY